MRFESIGRPSANIRTLLRARMVHHLPYPERWDPITGGDEALEDEDVLAAACSLRIIHGNSEEYVRREYSRLREKHPGAPTFEDAWAAGWFTIEGGKVQFHRVAHEEIETGNTDLTAVLLAILEKPFCLWSESVDDSKLPASIREHFEIGKPLPSSQLRVKTRDPQWVAARLWERMEFDGDDASRIIEWRSRCRMFALRRLRPLDVWSAKEARRFRIAAIAALERSYSDAEGWVEFIGRYVAGTDDDYFHQVTDAVGKIPNLGVERALWVKKVGSKREMHGMYYADDLCGFLVDTIINDDLQRHSHDRSADALGGLLLVAEKRPEVLLCVMTKVERHPELVAELALLPGKAVLASMLVLTWPGTAGGYNADLVAATESRGRYEAFCDTLAFVVRSIKSSESTIGDVAAFLIAIAEFAASEARSSKPYRAVAHESYTALVETLGQLEVDWIDSIASELINRLPDELLDGVVLGCTLDLLVYSANAEVWRVALIDAYRSWIGGNPSGTEFYLAISPAGARRLTQLALKRTDDLQVRFLKAVDTDAFLRPPEINFHEKKHRAALAVRAHIRVLCRAMAAWTGSIPDPIDYALRHYLEVGRESNEERGQIGALDVKFDLSPFRVDTIVPLYSELAEALHALGPSRARKVAGVLSRADEPHFLARLTLEVPALRDVIANPLHALQPRYAATAWSLDQIQARVDAILAEGNLDTAEAYIALEERTKTLGPVRGRFGRRLSAGLKLQLKRKAYSEVLDAELPEDVPKSERSECEWILTYFKAQAELGREDGDIERAARILSNPPTQHQSIQMTAEWLYAEVRRLFSTPFEVLEGERAIEAVGVLSQAERELGRPNLNVEVRNVAEMNMAFIELGIGRTHSTIARASRLLRSRLFPQSASCMAVALAREGRRIDAQTLLSYARKCLPNDIHVKAAATEVGELEFTPHQSTDLALLIAHLPGLDPVKQAALFHPDATEAHATASIVIDAVRAAGASLMDLAPSLRLEDDYTMILCELLNMRFAVLGWCGSQKEGGYSGSGGRGRRDIVLSKGSLTQAVIEAIRINRPMTQQFARDDVRAHFEKLLGYSACRVFVHLTYSLVGQVAEILEYLRAIATKECPDEVEFRQLEELESQDIRSPGFIVRYETSSRGEVFVAFIVLDLGQDDAKAMAKKAKRTNPRTKSKSDSKG